MIDVLVAMAADIQFLKTAFGNALKVGPVAQVDAERGYRIKWGTQPDGSDYLSPWLPHPESGGQTASWMPLSVGQIVGVMHPNGDQRQGVMFRAGFSGDTPAPSQDMAANVLTAFGITATMKDGKLTIAGDVEIAGNVDFTGGHVHHNGTPIDDTHVHSGIKTGPSNTGVPVG